MSAVMLGDIGQLPKASKPAEGVNYRALTGEVLRLRAELPRRWEALPEAERAALYRVALEAATFQPSVLHLVRAAPRALRLYRAGRVGDFLDYARTLSLLWDDILSLSENDSPAFQRDALDAIQEAREAQPIAVLRTREDIRDFFQNL
ncbi:hypothetical protein [Deinococcus sp. YIM 77859]|uniref:hypothetical protein n=1 Tax=Deinococcus sp. YIM 77859 TaxID=1540221 RepID=UPI000557508C|nr:hypothetical protein [Deinococcus sp. YIM 77859]